ncbi:MAG: hypothetical protein IT245_05975 [Bacteroidia bacterium]|nr:hypothetical protein [Bacteroidia bacterium]
MQRIILMCVLLIYTSKMNACDICGCSVMSGNPGILPNFQSHFIGYKHSFRSFNNTHPPSIINPEGTKSYNQYRTHELWGRWYPIKRIQVFASLPFNDFVLNEDGQSRMVSGFGDASLLFNYMVFNTSDSNRKFKHVFISGLGAKFNTGKFNSNEIAAFQIGSGTTDFQAYLSYTAKLKNFGALSEISAKHMGINPNHYNFGDKLFISEKLFYWKDFNKLSLLPHLGFLYEHSGVDKLNSVIQDYTGGSTTFLGVGMDAYVSNFSIGFNVYNPIQQSVGEGLIKESARLQINFLYLFNKKNKCQ